MRSTILFTSAALLSLANAHGIVQQVTVNGQTLTAPQIGHTADGPFFMPTSNSPVTDPTSPAIQCGDVASKATNSLEVAAGSTLNYYWSSGYSPTLTLWPHNTGPMFWYVAKCSGDCSASTQWFKLEQNGFENGVWKQANLKAGQTVPFTIPADLEAGEYTIRHEVINLANTPEFFPSCLQVKVTGSGTKGLAGTPATFPGAYSLSDAGIKVAGSAVYSIHDDAGYTFPGPPVAALGGGSGGSAPTTTAGATTTTETPATTIPVGNPGGNPSTTIAPTTTPATGTPTTTVATPTTTSGGGSGGSVADCAAEWTACNAKYQGSAADQSGYTCQQAYVSCVNQATGHAKRMHRRSHALFQMH